jgi:hypothetical protein
MPNLAAHPAFFASYLAAARAATTAAHKTSSLLVVRAFP